MAREKKQVREAEMTDGKREIIRMLLEEYDIESAADIQDALKDLLGGTIKEMIEARMNGHLGYGKSARSGRMIDFYSHVRVYNANKGELLEYLPSPLITIQILYQI